MGIWYVNAHIPTSFESKCTNAVEYYHWNNEKKPNERPGIKNRFYCVNENSNETVKMDGHAWVHDTRTNAEWKVEFFWPFAFSYWVIGMSPDYKEVVIGHPSRDYLWVMSRRSDLSADRIEYWMRESEKQGFSREKLRVVPFTRGYKISDSELEAVFK